DQLGMLGVSMTCSCFDRSTAEAEFEPLYQEMNRRRTVLNYHPVQNGICSPMINDYKFTVSVGASLEDAAIVLHLIARRVPERFFYLSESMLPGADVDRILHHNSQIVLGLPH